MTSTTNSDLLLKVENLSLYFELQYFHQKNFRDVFVQAITNPVDYFWKNRELLQVLKEINFELKRNMRLGIIGVNGSGKTSLCRCLAGMMVPQKGKISSKAVVRAIFDTGAGIMPELTGRENAYLIARLFYPEERDLRPIVEEALAFSELGHFVDIPFNQYSKGMQSRLMLTLISAKTSDVLILDEVFDGADIFFQQKLAKRMKTFIANAGATIFVSHSADQIKEVCTHVMVLDKGVMKYFGEVEEGLKIYNALYS